MLKPLPPNFPEYQNTIEKKIDYQFKNSHLLFHSLCHKSWTYEQHNNDAASYERLEFLGDAVLNLVVKDFLFHKLSDKNEGELTELTKIFVNSKFLSEKARELNLGELIFLTDSEQRDGGREKGSILSDVYEALIAAIYLDSSFLNIKNFLHRFHLQNYLELIDAAQYIDPKGELINYLRQYDLAPQFKLVKEEGPDHRKQFLIEIFIVSQRISRAWGHAIKEAEQKAAQRAIKALKDGIYKL